MEVMRFSLTLNVCLNLMLNTPVNGLRVYQYTGS